MAEETRIGPFGRGSMGVVYAARHEGRPVALKVSRAAATAAGARSEGRARGRQRATV